MKKIINFSLLISSFLILSSCEDVIQIKLDEGSKLYVIDAFINNLRSNQTVRVLTNDSYFSNREAPPVANAVVVLTDLNNNNVYNFNYTGNGNYVYNLIAGDTIARVGHQYRLDVTIDSFTYTALAQQPRGASIDSIAVFPDENGFGPPKKDTTYSCYLFAKDKADNNPDYYWIKTFRNDTLFNQPSDININIDGTGGIVTGAPQDSIDFTPPSTFLGFKTYKKGDSCKVQIHSISKESYFFFIQSSNQINNGGLFATTPENVKTNIISPNNAKTKAIGRFNMSTVSTARRKIQ